MKRAPRTLEEADKVIRQAREALLYVCAEPAAKSEAFAAIASQKFFAAHERCSEWIKAITPLPPPRRRRKK